MLCVCIAIMSMNASPGFACTECHSKNPKMVRMHEALEYKDCFVCHGPTAKKTGEAPNVRMTRDELCVRCHAGSNALPLQQEPTQ